MKKEEIQNYLAQLNEELRIMDVKGEICLYGGTVMCLVYEARPSTKDVDAIFEPTDQIRKAASRVAEANHLREDWLNDAVKGFIVSHSQRILFNFSNLKVYVPEPDYLLAMKALASRVDATDKQDVLFLIKQMNIHSPEEVFSILGKYYPNQQIRPATQFFIEELFNK